MVETGDGFSPQDHVFSTEGSWLYGIGAMAFSLWRTWVTDKKQRGETPSESIVEMNASARMSNITTIALLSGFLGAKVFHLLDSFHILLLLQKKKQCYFCMIKTLKKLSYYKNIENFYYIKNFYNLDWFFKNKLNIGF